MSIVRIKLIVIMWESGSTLKENGLCLITIIWKIVNHWTDQLMYQSMKLFIYPLLGK